MYLNELEYLFGHTPQNKGTLIRCGGVRMPTPSTESEHTPQDDLAADSVCHRGKRPASRKQSSGNPRKRKSSSLEDYVKDISESIAIRSSKHDETKKRRLIMPCNL